jgi:hypothetical protein
VLWSDTCCILHVISPNEGYINKTSGSAMCSVKSPKHNFSYIRLDTGNDEDQKPSGKSPTIR